MTEICKVTKVKNNLAYVEIERRKECESCKVCAFNDSGKVVVPALMDEPAKPGDTVLVEMPSSKPAYASLILFGVPLLMFLVGLAVGRIAGSDLYMILAGFACLILGIFIGFFVERLIVRKRIYMPVISRNLGSYNKSIEVNEENNNN